MKKAELKHIIKEEIQAILDENAKDEILAMRPKISPEIRSKYVGMTVGELLILAKKMTEDYVNGKI